MIIGARTVAHSERDHSITPWVDHATPLGWQPHLQLPRMGKMIFAIAIILVCRPVMATTVLVSCPGEVEVGSIFTIEVDVQSVSDLYGAQFDVHFNPDVLRAKSASEGNFLKQGANVYWNSPDIDNDAGIIDDAAVVRTGVSEGVDGSGTLATMVFEAKATGSTTISLNDVSLSNSDAQPIATTVQGASMTVIPPPEPPATQITSGPTGVISIRNATFTWSGSDPDGQVTSYQYRVDGGSWVTTVQTSKTFTNLTKGMHSFSVRAVDDDGLKDLSPPVRSFEVYFTSNPETHLLRATNGTVEGQTASFQWYGTDADGQISRFQYRLDNGTWETTEANSITFSELSHGNHTFEIRAVDDEGLKDPSPAFFEFTLIPYWWEEEIERLNRDVDELEGKMSEKQTQLDSARAELANLEGENDDLRDQIRVLEASLADLSGEKEVLQETLSQLGLEKSQLLVELEQLEGDIEVLRSNISSLSNSLAITERNKTVLEGEIASLTGELAHTQEELAEIRRGLNATKFERDNLQYQVEILESRSEDLEAQVEAKFEQISKLTLGGEALRSSKQEVEKKYVKLLGEKESLTNQISNLKERLRGNRSRVNALENTTKNMDSEIDLLEKENQRLIRTTWVLGIVIGLMIVVSAFLLFMVLRLRKGPGS